MAVLELPTDGDYLDLSGSHDYIMFSLRDGDYFIRVRTPVQVAVLGGALQVPGGGVAND